MGLASYFLGEQNPVSQWVGSNRNMLLGASAGFLQGRPGSGVLEGKMVDDAYATAEKEKAERANQIKQAAAAARAQGAEQLAQLIESSGDIGTGISMHGAMSKQTAQVDPTETVAGRQQLAGQYGLEGAAATEFILTGKLPGGNQSVRAGMGQPIPVRNTTTQETGAAMPMSDGTFWNPFTQEPFGPEWQFDPAWVAAQRAQGAALGEDVGSAQFDLPRAELTKDQTLTAINTIRANEAGMDEQFGNILGIPQQMTPAWPQTPKATFQNDVKRATDRAFLEAREMLRGGGQITDFESRKAETAITNMELAMQSGDKKQFLAALDEFERAVKDGYEKLKQQGAMLPPVGGAAPAGGGYTVKAVR